MAKRRDLEKALRALRQAYRVYAPTRSPKIKAAILASIEVVKGELTKTSQ